MEAVIPTPPDLVVRVAGEADVAALSELRALWSGETEPDAGLLHRMASWIASEGERRTTWLATMGGRPVGMVSLFEYRRMPKPGREDSRWGYVGSMFVREDSRQRGIGSALLAELVGAAEERSYVRLVVSPSAEGWSLYGRAGFVVPGTASNVAGLLVRPGGSDDHWLDPGSWGG
jgi:GNAT superfamily N-acetyltransferase